MPQVKISHMLVWSTRWRLGALTGQELMNIGCVSVIIGFLFILFHIMGNSVESANTDSAFVWMVSRWGDRHSFGADYSHGFLVPFVSLWVIWYKRSEFLLASKKVFRWGLAVVVLALLMHWLGAKMQQTRISLMSLILLLWAIPLYFFGWQVAKLLIFPCAYLLFCVPLNFLDSLSVPLQRIAVSMGYVGVQALGIECERTGNMLISPYFQLNVNQACSGLRSVLAITSITAIYAYYTQKTMLKKWLLFLLSIPIAVIGNVCRVISIAIVSIVVGQQFGAGLHHDWAGYIFFLVAIGLMVCGGAMFNFNYRGCLTKWKKAYLDPL